MSRFGIDLREETRQEATWIGVGKIKANSFSNYTRAYWYLQEHISLICCSEIPPDQIPSLSLQNFNCNARNDNCCNVDGRNGTNAIPRELMNANWDDVQAWNKHNNENKCSRGRGGRGGCDLAKRGRERRWWKQQIDRTSKGGPDSSTLKAKPGLHHHPHPRKLLALFSCLGHFFSLLKFEINMGVANPYSITINDYDGLKRENSLQHKILVEYVVVGGISMRVIHNIFSYHHRFRCNKMNVLHFEIPINEYN